jgi:hypothetical protein
MKTDWLFTGWLQFSNARPLLFHCIMRTHNNIGVMTWSTEYWPVKRYARMQVRLSEQDFFALQNKKKVKLSLCLTN